MSRIHQVLETDKGDKGIQVKRKPRAKARSKKEDVALRDEH